MLLPLSALGFPNLDPNLKIAFLWLAGTIGSEFSTLAKTPLS